MVGEEDGGIGAFSIYFNFDTNDEEEGFGKDLDAKVFWEIVRWYSQLPQHRVEDRQRQYQP